MREGLPEVLAPAGSPEVLKAAVRSGAAAVYLGLGAFNARRSAHNFTPDDLREAVAYCHARGVKVHLTLNTLVRDDELDKAMETAFIAADRGVDALIVQDVGLAGRLKAAMPAMPLHASTQLSCHTPEGVKALRDAGFSRVVLAREMSREEIAACTGLDVELEVFVHGALCMSVSGQCYFSAMLGGRSGNRGACAQTCRLPFAPTGSGKPLPCSPACGALSLKDNCLLDYVADLKAMGITSFKIEGRMKRPEYVAAATAVYAAAVRGEAVDENQREQLQAVFSRSGFTDGYYTARRGGGMFGTRRKEDVTAAEGVLKQLAHTYDGENPLVPVDMAFTADGEKTVLTAADPFGHAVTVTGEGAQAALHRPLDTERAAEQLKKTGGTPYFADTVSVSCGEGLTLPMAQLNGLRREALANLEAAAGEIIPVAYDKTKKPAGYAPISPAEKPARWVRVASEAQLPAELDADLVFLPLHADADTVRRLSNEGKRVGIDIPRGMFGTEEEVTAALIKAKEAGAAYALCGNIGAVAIAEKADLTPVGGFGLNIMNTEALDFYRGLGLAFATLSMELTFSQMAAFAARSLPVGILVYGRQPLMLTRNCPRKSAVGSCEDCRHQGITDRTGTAFPVMCAGGCTEVLNSVPLYWGDKPAELPKVDFHLFHFTTESAREAAQILKAYRDAAPAPGAITRGLYRRGVE